MQVLSWRDLHAGGGANVEMFIQYDPCSPMEGPESWPSWGKRQLSLVFEMQEEEFARERRTGVSAGPEFAQASGSGW